MSDDDRCPGPAQAGSPSAATSSCTSTARETSTSSRSAGSTSGRRRRAGRAARTIRLRQVHAARGARRAPPTVRRTRVGGRRGDRRLQRECVAAHAIPAGRDGDAGCGAQPPRVRDTGRQRALHSAVAAAIAAARGDGPARAARRARPGRGGRPPRPVALRRRAAAGGARCRCRQRTGSAARRRADVAARPPGARRRPRPPRRGQRAVRHHGHHRHARPRRGCPARAHRDDALRAGGAGGPARRTFAVVGKDGSVPLPDDVVADWPPGTEVVVEHDGDSIRVRRRPT